MSLFSWFPYIKWLQPLSSSVGTINCRVIFLKKTLKLNVSLGSETREDTQNAFLSSYITMSYGEKAVKVFITLRTSHMSPSWLWGLHSCCTGDPSHLRSPWTPFVIFFHTNKWLSMSVFFFYFKKRKRKIGILRNHWLIISQEHGTKVWKLDFELEI